MKKAKKTLIKIKQKSLSKKEQKLIKGGEDFNWKGWDLDGKGTD